MIMKCIWQRLFVLGTIVIITNGIAGCKPKADWVSGAARIKITKMTFTGQQCRAECSSAEIIDYLNKCLAQPRVVFDEPSYPYTCTVVTSDGTTLVINSMIGIRGGMLGLRTSEAEDYVYGVDRLSPIPASYTALIAFLADPKLKPGAVAKF
jgi:hypothetical protein